MRELKFRAWDEQGKIMHIPMTLSQIFQIGKNQELAIMGLKFKLAFDNLTFMQYTGLKDKNGKEIYEGDVIRFETVEGVLVIWRSDLASFALSKEEWAFDHFFKEGVDPEKCEVTGNIYENL